MKFDQVYIDTTKYRFQFSLVPCIIPESSVKQNLVMTNAHITAHYVVFNHFFKRTLDAKICPSTSVAFAATAS